MQTFQNCEAKKDEMNAQLSKVLPKEEHPLKEKLTTNLYTVKL